MEGELIACGFCGVSVTEDELSECSECGQEICFYCTKDDICDECYFLLEDEIEEDEDDIEE